MRPIRILILVLFATGLLFEMRPALAQGSKADYERADQLRERFRNKVHRQSTDYFWILDESASPKYVETALWFNRRTPDKTLKWLAVDFATGKIKDAFDHNLLASELGKAVGRTVDPGRLPIKGLGSDGRQLFFTAFNKDWKFNLQAKGLEEFERKSEVFGSGGSRPPVHPISPDMQWRAEVKNNNVRLLKLNENRKPIDGESKQLTTDGHDGHGYRNRFYWSPDSKKLVVLKRKDGEDRRVTIIDSSPDDQLQPKVDSYRYLKPGDEVAVDRPVMIDIETGQKIEIRDKFALNPFDIDGVRWHKNGHSFTYEYNQRGHQIYRVIEVDAKTGESRIVIDEKSDTFITYHHNHFLHYLDASDEILWLSERDGWDHLYLYDWKSGKVKRQLTRGEWVVRNVDRVDAASRTVWFWAGGIHKDQDPYYLQYCRVDMDSGKVTPLTSSNGTHADAIVSPSGDYLVTTWSRVDHASVQELRNAKTGELIAEIARDDMSALIKAGWKSPEPFIAKGRGGKTDIYGVIIKPTNFDPDQSYPVIEHIYAGPHSAFVPKRFRELLHYSRLAELGFIVVQIDGMGTNYRGKAFHDVAWKNLKDAGFPDRIAWMKAAAKDRPWMDLARVGIYGGSAGGQNAMRAVLDHADFYKAAAADCGCHDNRMDKIWWNEQWMGWPVDESYEKSSNVVDAHKLGGKLLLTVGELDKNVDPASTMQVVDALIKANKDFEFMVFPGGGHGAGESRYGRRIRADFFVRHLMGKTPRWE